MELLELTVYPWFNPGFTFSWTVHPGIRNPYPWKFVVQQSNNSPEGPWTNLSDELEDQTLRTWSETEPRRQARDIVPFFRVALIAGSSTVYSSPTKTIAGTIDPNTELLIQEILRREELYARVKAGVRGKVFLRNEIGIPCPKCVDPIMGSSSLGSECSVCGGTRIYPPFNGPYPVWLTFETSNRETHNAENGVGKISVNAKQVRVAGSPQLRTDDIIVDTSNGDLLVVEAVQVATELRRIPIVQIATASELPTVSTLHNLEALRV